GGCKAAAEAGAAGGDAISTSMRPIRTSIRGPTGWGGGGGTGAAAASCAKGCRISDRGRSAAGAAGETVGWGRTGGDPSGSSTGATAPIGSSCAASEKLEAEARSRPVSGNGNGSARGGKVGCCTGRSGCTNVAGEPVGLRISAEAGGDA